LGFARGRGFQESGADWISLLDDDNTVEPDFLEVLIEVTGKHERIGGIIPWVAPVWEREPEPQVEAICATCLSYNSPSFGAERVEQLLPAAEFERVERPPGGGMIVHQSVARLYAQADGKRMALGRTGESLIGCEDHDIWMGIKQLGLDMIRTNRLRLYHHIPASRTELKYLLRLNYSMSMSYGMLEVINAGRAEQPSLGARATHLLRLAKIGLTSPRHNWRGQMIEASRCLGRWAGQKNA
jgi:glucosyl-dolichyl phosphate glucuronosyltransferase